ncbi:GNAT family N-acetyltransferase [Treponema sp. OMZ 840]
MIDRYLEHGTLYVLNDDGVKAVCVVTDEGNGVLEIKNLAVDALSRNKGYGKKFIDFIGKTYAASFSILRVGTGDSPLTLPFYEKCGFKKAYTVKNFFTDNYKQPIIEAGVRLIDMIYLEKKLTD